MAKAASLPDDGDLRVAQRKSVYLEIFYAVVGLVEARLKFQWNTKWDLNQACTLI